MITTYSAAASAACAVRRLGDGNDIMLRHYLVRDEHDEYMASVYYENGKGSVGTDCPCTGTARDCPHVQAAVVKDMEDRAHEAVRAQVKAWEAEA